MPIGSGVIDARPIGSSAGIASPVGAGGMPIGAYEPESTRGKATCGLESLSGGVGSCECGCSTGGSAGLDGTGGSAGLDGLSACR